MYRVLLINDTADLCHWGCYATCEAIRQEVRQRGFAIETIKAKQIPRLGRYISRASDFDAPEPLSQLQVNHPELIAGLERCDYVLINGEGSLHGNRNVAKTLLFIAYVGATLMRKPVDIINHSCYPSDFDDPERDPTTLAIYRKAYEAVNQVVVREPVSHALVTRTLRADAQLGFDCLPLYLRQTAWTKSGTGRGSPQVTFSGSVQLTRRHAKAICSVSRTLARDRIASRLLIGSKSTPNHEDIDLVQSIEKIARRRRYLSFFRGHPVPISIVHAASFDEWLGCIDDAALLVSGRFHHTIAAICTGTSFLVGKTNTPKVTGLLTALHQECRTLSFEDRNWHEQVCQQARASVEAAPDPALVDHRIRTLSDKALTNFVGLDELA